MTQICQIDGNDPKRMSGTQRHGGTVKLATDGLDRIGNK
jgi:hypothetical protein